MPQEYDLLVGLLACRMDFVTGEQLLECVRGWLGDGTRGLADRLQERGYLGAEARIAAEAAADACVQPRRSDSPADVAVEPELREALLALDLPAPLRRWLLALPAQCRGSFLSAPRRERYRVGDEIARGALGRVVEAEDRDLRREVAVKLVLDGLGPEYRERFVREARITASLQHPHIVPVHDFGHLPGADGRNRLFLSMKRIRGVDLWRLLKSIQRGEVEARKYTRARLLSLFQGVCLGIAYAHSRGVVHRDLKPSNIMIGEFGESLIVDWGLAKVAGEAEPALPEGTGPRSVSASPRGDPGLTALTLAGDVIGTPSYMPPEQAEGRNDEVDARSDVYALGGVLYTILTWKPPFQGETDSNVLTQVKTGLLLPPSVVVSDAWTSLGLDPRRDPARDGLPEPVPSELDEICLKAMSWRPEGRFQTAMDLHDAIQQFLEGTRERERQHELADRAVERAKETLARHERLKDEAEQAAREVRRIAGRVSRRSDKEELWKAEDLVARLRQDTVDAFSEADAALTAALEHFRDHPEAARLKAGMYWRKFEEAEASGDAEGMLLHRRAVERYDDGAHAARLRGDGTLSLAVAHWTCPCLREGRLVDPAEFLARGHHIVSGRALDGHRGGQGAPGLESQAPLTLRVHAASCRTEPLHGADVWLFRFEAIGRRRLAVTPAIAGLPGGPPPDNAVNRLFTSDSPYRPQGPGVWLGRTPVAKRALPMGSWLLLVARDGFEPARVPVSIGRCADATPEVTLLEKGEAPEGFVQIAGGPFLYQGEDDDADPETSGLRFLPGFWIQRYPVRCGEYAAYLNELAREDAAGAARRDPREAPEGRSHWPGPPWVVPDRRWLAEAPRASRERLAPLMGTAAPWDAEWPVVSISWYDAIAWCAWRTRREGRLFTLPFDPEWEKAARGVDGRLYPWGDVGDNRWTNTNRSLEGGMQPVPVTDFPADESPYGARGLGGNVRNQCLDAPGSEYPGWRFIRGGDWRVSPQDWRSVERMGGSADDVTETIGFRCAWRTQLE